jgi:hypothetical protein
MANNDIDALNSLYNDIKKDYEDVKVLLSRLHDNINKLNYNSSILNQYEDFNGLDIFSSYRAQTIIRGYYYQIQTLETALRSYELSLKTVELQMEEKNVKRDN